MILQQGPGEGQIEIIDKENAVRLGLAGKLFREVLQPSFPPEELGEPWEEGYVPDGQLLVAANRKGTEVLGCAISEFYPLSRVLLLGYLAVKPGARRLGVGSALMQTVIERWCQGGTLVLAEIDDPRHHEPHEKYGDPWARLRFYRRFNVMALDAPYFQPSLGPGYPRAYHLILCRLASGTSSGSSKPLNGQLVRVFLTEYFTSCEGWDVLADPELRWLLSSYGETVGLLPLAEIDRVPHLEPLTRGPA